MVNWCSVCNGRGRVGWLWWAKVCPWCKASTEKHLGCYLNPVPPRPVPPPTPVKQRAQLRPGHATRPVSCAEAALLHYTVDGYNLDGYWCWWRWHFDGHKTACGGDPTGWVCPRHRAEEPYRFLSDAY